MNRREFLKGALSVAALAPLSVDDLVRVLREPTAIRVPIWPRDRRSPGGGTAIPP